jgi:hypothetical protein
MKVEVFVTSVYPEMHGVAEMIWGRQHGDCHLRLDRSDRSKSRWEALADLVEGMDDDTDFFMLGDDDDYVSPDYVEHCPQRAEERGLYGEIPSRTYMLRRQSGKEGFGRTRLFSTFVLFRCDLRRQVLQALRSDKPAKSLQVIFAQHQQSPPHSDKLVIMRGMMDDPASAITARKNVADKALWPRNDRDYAMLRDWVDEGMFEYLLRFAGERGW